MMLPDLSRLSLRSSRCEPCGKHYPSWMVNERDDLDGVAPAEDPDPLAAGHTNRKMWTPNQTCPLCLEPLRAPDANGAADDYEGARDVEVLIENPRCGHMYHTNCLRAAILAKRRSCVQCRSRIAQSVFNRLAPEEKAREGDPDPSNAPGNPTTVPGDFAPPPRFRPLVPGPVSQDPGDARGAVHRRYVAEWLSRSFTYIEGLATGLGRMPPATHDAWATGQSNFRYLVMHVRVDRIPRTPASEPNRETEYDRLMQVREMLRAVQDERVPRREPDGRTWSADKRVRRGLLHQLARLYFNYWMSDPALTEGSRWRELLGQPAVDPALLDDDLTRT